MIHAYLQNEFRTEFVGTIVDMHIIKTLVENKQINLIESGGIEGADHLRISIYPYTHVCVICYDISNVAAFRNIKHRV